MQPDVCPSRVCLRTGALKPWSFSLLLAVLVGCGGRDESHVVTQRRDRPPPLAPVDGMDMAPLDMVDQTLQIGAQYVAFEPGSGRFPLVADGSALPLWVSAE